MAGRRVWRPASVLATVDHNIPIIKRERASTATVVDPLSRLQIDQLDRNCAEFGLQEFGLKDRRQGIIHVHQAEAGCLTLRLPSGALGQALVPGAGR